jgi:hypothetical protein
MAFDRSITDSSSGEAGHAVVQLIVAGQENNRQVTRCTGGAQPATGLEGVQAHAHLDVEKHQVGQPFAAHSGECGQGILARAGLDDFVAGGGQRNAEHSRHDGIVIDNQDAAAGGYIRPILHANSPITAH